MNNSTVAASRTSRSHPLARFVDWCFATTNRAVSSRQLAVATPAKEIATPAPFSDPVVFGDKAGEDLQTPTVRVIAGPSPEVETSGALPAQIEDTSGLESVSPVPVLSEGSLPSPVRPELAANMPDLNKLLFQALTQAKAAPFGDFRVGTLIHDLFEEEWLLCEVARELAQPYADGGKKISGIVGMGSYGTLLAQAMVPYFPALVSPEETPRPVKYFPIEKSCGDINTWNFASDEKAGQQLRAKRVILVLPVLTQSTSVDVERCIARIEEGLGTNTTVFGVATIFALNPKKGILRARGKPLVVDALRSLVYR